MVDHWRLLVYNISSLKLRAREKKKERNGGCLNSLLIGKISLISYRTILLYGYNLRIKKGNFLLIYACSFAFANCLLPPK